MRLHNCQKIFKDECKWYKFKRFFRLTRKISSQHFTVYQLDKSWEKKASQVIVEPDMVTKSITNNQVGTSIISLQHSIHSDKVTTPPVSILDPEIGKSTDTISEKVNLNSQPDNNLPITVKDIQAANKRIFETMNNNIIIPITTQKHSILLNNNNIETARNRKTLSFATSSIYLTDTDVELKPIGNIYLSKEKSKILLQTINSLLEETECIYKEICPDTTIKFDVFDNLTDQLEPTILEEDSLSEYNNKELSEGIGDAGTRYDYLVDLLRLYMETKGDSSSNNSNLQTYKGFSGSTLVLTT